MSGAAGTLRDWTIGRGLEGGSIAELLGGFADGATAAGVPLSRAYFALPAINPEFRALNLIWRRGKGVVREGVEHDRFPLAFDASPIAFMLEREIPRRRWRLEDPAVRAEFALLGELHAEGDTDYIAHIVRFGGTATALQGIALTACTDRPGGFELDEIALMTELVPPLALAAHRIALSDILRDVLDAYVGHDAARRILNGEIRRGHGHRLPAAIAFADLRGFTSLSEGSGETLIARLGDHLEAVAGAVEANGGEVLKFMGDGALAGFPVADAESPGEACTAALAAAREAIRRNDAVNALYPGTPALLLDDGLHRGEVFYGNVGGGGRLDFTVIGPAVNEASRIEALCGRLDHPILMSGPFAECCGCAVVSVGRHALKGIAEPREIFAPA